MIRRLSVAIVLLVGAQSASAQTAPLSSHVDAAHELIDAMHLETNNLAVADQMYQANSAANPEMAAAIRGFLAKYLSWDVMKEEYTREYVANFSEAELHEMTAFYRSTVGQKLAVTTPVIVQGINGFVRSILSLHSAEMREAILSARRPQ